VAGHTATRERMALWREGGAAEVPEEWRRGEEEAGCAIWLMYKAGGIDACVLFGSARLCGLGDRAVCSSVEWNRLYVSTNGRESLPMAGIRRSFSNATPPCSFLGIRKLHCSVERDERNVPRVRMHKLYFQPPEKPEETRHTCKHDEASALHLLT